MKKEIKIRQKRICIWILIAALLWNSSSPVVVQADITRNDASGATISYDEILMPGEVIYCSEEKGMTLYYRDYTMDNIIYDDDDEIAGIMIENSGTHTVINYPLTLNAGESFGGWKVSSIYQSAGDVSALELTPILNYAITYETYGGVNSVNNPTSYTYRSEVIKLEEATKLGYTFEGWYTDAAFTEETWVGSIGEGDIGPMTLYAKFTPNTYTVIYYTNDGINADSNPTEYVYGTDVTLNDASMEGYTFEGWYTYTEDGSSNKVTAFSEAVTERTKETIELYAKFNPNITYYIDGELYYDAENKTYVEGVGVVLENVAKPGHTFSGWYTDADCTDGNQITEITANESGPRTVYGKFTVDTYAITYELNDGTNSPDNPDRYTYGTEIILADANKNGYIFAGWYTDAEFSEGSKVSSISAESTGDVTLYAKYEAERYEINYELDGGENAETNPIQYIYGEGVENFEGASKEGYVFMGWYDESGEQEITSISAEAMGAVTLYAKYEAEIYEIIYELDGGENAETNPIQYIYGEGVENLEAASKEGYVFMGWYDESGEQEITSISAEAMGAVTLYAKYEAEIYEIIYELDGGENSENNPTEYSYGEGVEHFEGATKEGYVFMGWYDESGEQEITSISAEAMGAVTLYAKFNPNITYYIDGEIYLEAENQTYVEGTGVVLENVVKPGHTFSGWYTDADCTDGNQITEITANESGPRTVYGKFTVDTYAITYELNDGTNSPDNPDRYTYGTEIILADANKNGYIFAGWYTDAEFSEDSKVTSITAESTGDVTLYAKYTEVESDTDTDPVVFENSGTVEVKAGIAYTLGSGTWKVTGDETSYAGGMTFYVAEDGSYEFVKQ